MNMRVSRIFKTNLIWKTLAYFLCHPSREIYVNELARLLKVGPTGANNSLKKLESMGLLRREEKARSHFYSLNNESIIAKPLKTAYFAARLQDLGFVNKLLEIDENIISLCVFGSFANGAFDEASDLDLLIMSQKDKKAFYPVVSNLEKLLNLEISAEIVNMSKWKRIKEEDKGFYREVISSYMLLYGSEI